LDIGIIEADTRTSLRAEGEGLIFIMRSIYWSKKTREAPNDQINLGVSPADDAGLWERARDNDGNPYGAPGADCLQRDKFSIK
jgi:hypothetical protein